MPGPHLTSAELAAELGRSQNWLMDNWRSLVTARRLPAPLHDTQPYVWSRAHVYAWLDRGLTADQRLHAAAWRAAADAAGEVRISGDDRLFEAQRTAALMRRFAPKGDTP